MSPSDSSSWNELQQLVEQAETEEDLQAALELLEQLQGPDEPAADPGGRWMVRTLGEVAEFLGMEVSTLWGFRTGANPMPGEEGRWDLSKITQWRCERLKANAGNVKSAKMRELEEQEQEIKVSRDAARLREELGELVSRVASKAVVSAMFNEIRVQMESWPEIIGASVPPEYRNLVVREVGNQVELLCQLMANKANE